MKEACMECSSFHFELHSNLIPNCIEDEKSHLQEEIERKDNQCKPTFKYIEFLIYLKELKGTSSTPTLFFCFSVVYILQIGLISRHISYR